MKKLKCSSCGGNLEIDENQQYATCKHCETKYKLNEDLNVNIKLDDNISKKLNGTMEQQKSPLAAAMMIGMIFVFGVIFIVTAISMSRMHSENDKSSFNFQFENKGGTKSAFLLSSTLDDIVQNNKTNSRKVKLVYDGKETTDEKEIIEIKHSLSGNYEVTVNYGEDGYVSEIVLEKLN